MSVAEWKNEPSWKEGRKHRKVEVAPVDLLDPVGICLLPSFVASAEMASRPTNVGSQALVLDCVVSLHSHQ